MPVKRTTKVHTQTSYVLPHGDFKCFVHISGEKQQLFYLQQLQNSFHNLEKACLLHDAIRNFKFLSGCS